MKNFIRTYTLPFKFDIPNYTQDFINKNNLILTYFKFLKRSIYLILKNQSKLEIQKIHPNHQKILWINLSAPSLGDSLMDLSCRILLKGRIIDLYTDKKNFHLFINDEVFNNVYSQAEELEKNSYDLVILDSYSTRTIKVKSNLMPLIPFVGMYGYFNGPEVNRVLFSFHRMNQLLEYAKNEEEINHSARALLSISNEDSQLVGSLKLPEEYISIAIGGEWNYRTYNKWYEVITLLIDINPNLNIVLIGSKNALEASEDLIRKISLGNVLSYVDKLTFMQTAEIINKSQLLICCDGGLMHAANALNTPILPIFARLTPQMQLTESILSFSLFDEDDVNNIKVSEIIDKYSKFANYVGSRLQAG
jgi:heptosyltransferase-2